METAFEKITRLERNLDAMRKRAAFYDDKMDFLSERLERAVALLSAYDELLEKFVELHKRARSWRGDNNA